MTDPKKVAATNDSVLASQVATTNTDPAFYAALKVLPNPDTVLRKLGKSQEVFDAISYDPHVMGDLKSIQTSVNKRKWRIVPGGEEAQDVAAYELCKSVFDERPAPGLSWNNTIWNMFQALLRGYAVHEVVWQNKDGYMVPASIEDVPNRRFAFGSENELRLLTKANQTDGEAVPNLKFLMTRHLPSKQNPYGIAVYSALFWAYTFKHNGMRWFTKFVEKFGIPKAIGKYPVGTQVADIDKLAEALASMIEDSVAAIPEGSAVDLLEAKSSGTEPHLSLIDNCNAEMSKALTSQTLGSDAGDNGSRALGDVHKERQNSRSDAVS